MAALGISFSVPAMGAQFADGMFIGQHGSWNRPELVGYKVIFVPFRDGSPIGEPIDFISGFLGDDLSNTIWRVTPVGGG